MLQAHSLLWNYLWVAPNILLLLLAAFVWKRGIWRQIPAFLVFAILSGLGDLTVFAADIASSVSPQNFWRIDWGFLLIESLLKFIVFGEVFATVFNPYRSISRLGRISVSGLGATLVLLAALIAAFGRGDSRVGLISGAHLLEQTIFIVELGVILFLFLFARYFRLLWDRRSFGVMLGFGVSSCVHLAAWAIVANANPSARGRTLLDFLEMGTHHICVLIWCYYLLTSPKKTRPKVLPSMPPSAPTEKELADLNRELERLVHQ